MGLSRCARSLHRDLYVADLDDDLEQSKAVGNRVGINRIGLACVFVLAEDCQNRNAVASGPQFFKRSVC